MDVLKEVYRIRPMGPVEGEATGFPRGASREVGESTRALATRKIEAYPYTLAEQQFRTGYTIKLYLGNKLVSRASGMNQAQSSRVFKQVLDVIRTVKEDKSLSAREQRVRDIQALKSSLTKPKSSGFTEAEKSELRRQLSGGAGTALVVMMIGGLYLLARGRRQT